MEKSLILAWILVLAAAMVVAPCRGYYSKAKPYAPAPKKVTHLHFFMHDTLSGKNPSAVEVARPNMTTAPNKSFGMVTAIDDLLTVGPNVTSKVIGNAQGLWVMTDRDIFGLTIYVDIGFTEGKFNGSSISIFSRNPISETERELAVVGGRGKFRMAQGFAQLKTYSVDLKNRDAIIEYNVTVIY